MFDMKFRAFLRAPDGVTRADFRAHMLAEVGPRLLAAAPGLTGLSLHLVDATPEVLPWQRPGESPAPTDGPAFDVGVEWRVGAAADAAPVVAVLRAVPAGTFTAVRVAEVLEKDQEIRRRGRRTGGVKFLSLMRFHADLVPLGARRSWHIHAPLALKVHAGMSRYVRDWVEEVLVSGGPGFHGIAELHFPSVETMMTRWFDSEEGRAAIIHDVAHFLEGSTRLYTTEHVLV